jgi:hypothetical protein
VCITPSRASPEGEGGGGVAALGPRLGGAPSVERGCIDTDRPMDVSKVKIKEIASRLPTHARAWTTWLGLFVSSRK